MAITLKGRVWSSGAVLCSEMLALATALTAADEKYRNSILWGVILKDGKENGNYHVTVGTSTYSFVFSTYLSTGNYYESVCCMLEPLARDDQQAGSSRPRQKATPRKRSQRKYSG